MSKRRVTLIGGTGFVGTQLTYRLAPHFPEVHVLTRRRQGVNEFATLSNVRVVEAKVHDPEQLQAALAGSDVVINLVGILNESGSAGANSFDGAHVKLTDSVIDVCKAQGVSRYLHMSALGADADNGSSEYLRSKGRAEQQVRAVSGLPAWTIFRPSIVFGERDAFFNRFASLLKMAPVLPLACPDARMAPVFVDDLCKVFLDAVDNPATHGDTISLCGPADYTLKELVEFTAKAAGLERKVIGLPDWAARLQGRIMEFVPGKPFTRDNYLSLQTPNVCGPECPRQPTSIQAIVPRYLGGNDVRGRMSSRRRHARR